MERKILHLPSVGEREARTVQKTCEQQLALKRSNAENQSAGTLQCATVRMGRGETRLRGHERAEYMRTFANARAGVPVTVLPRRRFAEKT